MSDNRRVYNQVLKTLKKLMPTTKQTYVVTLAMMISGIVTGKKAQLSTMSGEIPSQTAKSASIEMRMRRFVKNANCLKINVTQGKDVESKKVLLSQP